MAMQSAYAIVGVNASESSTINSLDTFDVDISLALGAALSLGISIRKTDVS